MSGVFSKYKEKFAPNAQTNLMNIIKSDKQMFQDYKKFFNREKMQGICRHLCDYVILNDLLVNKESFVKAFDSTEKKRSLVNDLIKKVKDSSIASDEVNKQKFAQEMYNSFDETKVFIEETNKIAEALLERMSEEVQKNFVEEWEQIFQKKIVKSPFLAMKKPKTLTVADLNLAAMDQNSYMKTSYQYMNDKHVGHDTNDKRAGHAVLIKKNSDNSFAFYDPNYGAVFDLTEEQLCEVVTQSFYDYIKMSRLCIVALFILLTSVVAGIAAAVYGYNIIASVSLIICLVDLSISCCLKEKLMPQCYNTVIPENNISIIDYNYQVELINLIDKYCGSNGKSEDASVIINPQVKSITENNSILGNVRSL